MLERGADWPSWGTGIRLRASNSAVEVQANGESDAEFHERVLSRIERIVREGMNLRAAGYACSLDGARRLDSRREICLRLLSVLDPGDGAEVILAGGAWETSGEEGGQRSALIQLWSEISDQKPGRVMSIRFEDPPTESGVFRAAEKLSDSRPINRLFDDSDQAAEMSRPPSNSFSS